MSTAKTAGHDAGSGPQAPDGPAEPAGSWPVQPHVLREYALVADGERGALVGPHGEVTWMCAPRWDSGAVFSALLGGSSAYRICPLERCTWGGQYEDGSLIWRSRWVTDTGAVVECRNALALPGDPHRVVLLRQVRAVTGGARVQARLDARADFDRHRLQRTSRDSTGSWTAHTGDLTLRWRAEGVPDDAWSAAARTSDAGWVLQFDLEAGSSADFVLEVAEGHLGDLVPSSVLWAGTEATWASRVPDLGPSWAPSQARHSVAVLTGLTSSSGAMVAAATTSLPEHADQGRDYDYRFAWVRDQCYAGVAAFTAGVPSLGDSAVGFISERLLADGARLVPAYTTSGDPVPDPEVLRLPGYPGGKDSIGNQVRGQFQLDGLGEALQLLATAARSARLDEAGRRAALTAASAIAERWDEPDAGIWELEPRWWAHSRLACAAGLRAWARAESAHGSHRARGLHGEDLASLADALVAETARRCTHPSGRWQRADEDDRADASLLLAGLRGAVTADDPRHLATLAAVQDELQVDGHTYRFRHDARPLGQAEGAFTLCNFWLVLAEAQAGQHLSAAARMERTLAACGPPALYSEEFDVQQRQLRGNLPQAFVHALALETSARLPDLLHGGTRLG